MSACRIHHCESPGQQPDPRPGFYYVTVRRDNGGAEFQTLRGPFVNDHAAALATVDESIRRAIDYDPRGCWYAYGTCRSEIDLGQGLFDRLDAKQGLGRTENPSSNDDLIIHATATQLRLETLPPGSGG